jgi:hypothetical protein
VEIVSMDAIPATLNALSLQSRAGRRGPAV